MIERELLVHRNNAWDWMEIGAEVALLGVESAGVVGLRLAGAATGGPQAAEEAWLMWSEKIIALSELQTRALAGSLGSTPAGAARATLRHYRRKVAANRRRLAKA